MALNHSEPLGDNKRIIVLGARSIIGHFLLPLLESEGSIPLALSRKQNPIFPSKHKWYKLKNSLLLTEPPLPKAQTFISLAPLWALPPLLSQFTGSRLIAFSSTSIYTKLHSTNDHERDVVRQLVKSESKVIQICKAHDIAWTILRPTLTYGIGLGKSIARIAEFIKRFGFFPIIAKGKGLRQPVYAGDLAEACLRAVNNSETFGKAYNLSGGETLSYHEMIRVIFQELQKKPRIIPIPPRLLKSMLNLANVLPSYRHINMAMFERMNEDLCFEHKEAIQDFGYSPQSFRLGVKEALS